MKQAVKSLWSKAQPHVVSGAVLGLTTLGAIGGYRASSEVTFQDFKENPRLISEGLSVNEPYFAFTQIKRNVDNLSVVVEDGFIDGKELFGGNFPRGNETLYSLKWGEFGLFSGVDDYMSAKNAQLNMRFSEDNDYCNRMEEMVKRCGEAVLEQQKSLSQIEKANQARYDAFGPSINSLDDLTENMALTNDQRDHLRGLASEIRGVYEKTVIDPEVDMAGISTNSPLGSEMKELIESYQKFLSDLDEEGYFDGYLTKKAGERTFSNKFGLSMMGGIGGMSISILPFFIPAFLRKRKENKNETE